MVLCLINGVTLCNLPYGSHKCIQSNRIMFGKLDKTQEKIDKIYNYS